MEIGHIEKISSAFHNIQSVDCFSRIVDWSEIEANNYDLSIQKYVFISDSQNALTDTLDSYVGQWLSQSKKMNDDVSRFLDLLS